MYVNFTLANYLCRVVELMLPWHKAVFGMMVHKYVLMCENGLERIPD
jgi:hypothetical protein